MSTTTAPAGPVALLGRPVRPAATPGSPGQVLALVRAHGELTRAELVELTGTSRSTVAARLDALVDAGLLAEVTPVATTRGRPPTRFRFREEGGVLALADAGATGVRVAVTDLGGRILDQQRFDLPVGAGPEPWLTEVLGHLDDALRRVGVTRAEVHGVGLALPGPVDGDAGTVVSPPIMTGWDRFPIRDWFAEHLPCPVVVENDANAMAVGEHRSAHADRSSMLLLKLATGVGAGLVIGGSVYRGFDGAAGDIGHIQVTAPDEGPAPACRCGNTGCIEAYAGGWALIRDLRAAGHDVSSVPEVVALVKAGDPSATALSRRAGRFIGIALSDAVSLLNPEVVVIGGDLAAAADHLFAGIRESVYARSLPLATRRLTILPSSQGDLAGLHGLAAAVADRLYAPERVDAMVAAG